jgi:hypothetical protein
LRQDATRLVSDVTPDPVREDDYARLNNNASYLAGAARHRFFYGGGVSSGSASVPQSRLRKKR